MYIYNDHILLKGLVNHQPAMEHMGKITSAGFFGSTRPGAMAGALDTRLSFLNSHGGTKHLDVGQNRRPRGPQMLV